jgi:phosphoserine phosphatase RsbU/P
LGLFDDIVLDEQCISLPPGSRIVLFTDGATDAVDPDGCRFTRERLKTSMQNNLHQSSNELCLTIFESIAKYQNGTPQTDDIALLSIKL